MSRSSIVLVCWDSAQAEVHAGALREMGYAARVFADRRENPRMLTDDPPDAFLIDLGRSPSQGRELGGFLRRQKATRHIPLVFVAGDPEKTEKVRSLLPDALFTTWDDASADLRRAIEAPPTDPVVPGAMDAYAGAPLVKKLGIREGHFVGLVAAPEGFEGQLEGLPEEVDVERGLSGHPDVLLLFVESESALNDVFPEAAAALVDGGRLWICWPKKMSGVASDLSQASVRAYGLAREFVDYKVASIDDTWSGLCFARRAR